MSISFGIPDSGSRSIVEAIKKEKLKAEGNLNYLEFIELVKHLWEEAHPDVPIQPTQAKNYARYPVIVYGLELRKTFTDENKARQRDQIKREDGSKVEIIKGQKFTNIIKFTVLTRNEPKLCEQIIELFEEFMDQHVPVFKRLGVSEFFYGRRLADADRTRPNEDVCERSVAYMVVLERLSQTSLDVIEKVAVSARMFLEEYGNRFTVSGANQPLVVEDNNFKLDDRVTVRSINEEMLPLGINSGWTYRVASVDGDEIVLSNFNGTLIIPSSGGEGRLYLNEYEPNQSPTHIEDLNQG